MFAVAITGFIRFNFTNGGDVIMDTPQQINPIVDLTKLNTKYIKSQDLWPPKASITAGSYSCTPSNTEVGKVEERDIDGHTYCINTLNEGAAGSTYSIYTYTSAVNTSTVARTTFTLRYVQCMNYDNPNQSECLAERKNFNPDIYAVYSIDSLIKELDK